jgi:hypothetical protein
MLALVNKILGGIFLFHQNIFAQICSCTNKMALVAVKGAKMAVILG